MHIAALLSVLILCRSLFWYTVHFPSLPSSFTLCESTRHSRKMIGREKKVLAEMKNAQQSRKSAQQSIKNSTHRRQMLCREEKCELTE